MSINTEDLLAAFDKMTILELSEFSKAFQERYGVTATAPMAMMPVVLQIRRRIEAVRARS